MARLIGFIANKDMSEKSLEEHVKASIDACYKKNKKYPKYAYMSLTTQDMLIKILKIANDNLVNLYGVIPVLDSEIKDGHVMLGEGR